MNAHLNERLRGNFRPSGSEKRPVVSAMKVEVNPDIRAYFQQQDKIRRQSEAEPWLQQPEFPANDEVGLLDREQIVQFAPNKLRGKWKSTARYLKAHFELLREDAISPLRDAVDSFKDDPHMFDNQNLSIYEKVHFTGFTFSHWGIAVRTEFSTARAQHRIMWSGSKRLVSGGLVALSPADDKFRNKCIVAVVAARPLEGVNLNPPQIDLYFIRPEDMEIDPQQEWLMVEARTGYYEAYRHNLLALQQMSSEKFPLSSHICSLSPDIDPPAYLQQDPFMNLAPACTDGVEATYDSIDVIKSWPDYQGGGLDKTQWIALQQILTKSLAVIQGPPGTGKTFVSTVALEILHAHLKHDDPPIIIAAQTNHALDQLLNHIARFEPNFIRLGGRSTNVDVKKRALCEVRKEHRIDLVPGSLYRKAMNVNREQSGELRELLSPLSNPNDALSIDDFVKIGAISAQQGESIIANASRWQRADAAEINPMELWLGGDLSRFQVEYQTEHFGLQDAEEDLELGKFCY
jgi:helicase required for RNAi-mediated heterochromatin assembly 1